MTQRIQVPGISASLVRSLELTAPPALELEETVLPVIVVGGTLSVSAEGSRFSPNVARIDPWLFSVNLDTAAGAAVTGYAGLVNPTDDHVMRVFRLRVSSLAAQRFFVYRLDLGHGLVGAGGMYPRDSRVAGLPTGGNGQLLNTNLNNFNAGVPAFARDIDHCRTLAGENFVFDTDIVIGPGGGAIVNTAAVNQAYSSTWVVELYRPR